MLTNIFRLTMVLASLLVSLLSEAQPKEAVDWINANAIAIPDADPAGSIADFASKAPKEFNDARLFGFGEATHHGKEFFDLKSKFFRYLVINNGVRVFMMEESYRAEAGINEWISGGKGDVSSILDNFQIAPWHCQEVVSLLQWMRDFNTGRPSDDQIRFYGIDSQFGKGIDDLVIQFASKKNIEIEESLLVALKESSAKQMIGKDEKWAAAHLLKIQRLEKEFMGYRDKAIPEETSEYNKIIRYLSVLKNYITYVGNGFGGPRDEQMFNNVK